MLFFLLITSLPSINGLNSFPKLFGSNSSDTILQQIDVYKDYLAMTGYTCDDLLTGLPLCIPYVALQSIETAEKIYWAKAFS